MLEVFVLVLVLVFRESKMLGLGVAVCPNMEDMVEEKGSRKDLQVMEIVKKEGASSDCFQSFNGVSDREALGGWIVPRQLRIQCPETQKWP